MIGRIKSLLLENQTTKQTVAKNTFWLFFGNILSKLIKAAILIYAVRVLSVEGWGVFSYALSIAGLFTIFIDFGINAVITRESVHNLEDQQKYFSTALGIKLVMAAVIGVVILVLSPFFISQSAVVALLPIVVLIVIFDSLRDFGAALARAWEKMEIEAVVQIATNLIIVIAGFVALSLVPQAKSLAIGYAIGTGLGMLVAFYPFRRYFKGLLASFSPNLIKKILYSSWPFGMLGVMGAIMLNTDTVMVGWFRSITEVGYYGAAQRVIQLVYLIPGLIATALFPSMAKLIENKERFKNVLERGLSLLTLFAVPATVGGVLLGRDIIGITFGSQYIPATGSFRLMCLTFLPIFLSAIFGNAVFALNKEKKLIAYVILGVIGNFLFDLILIPLWGIDGAALSTVINQTIITLYLIYVLRKEFHFSVLKQLDKIVLATIIMGIGVVIFRYIGLHVYLLTAIGLSLYLVSLYLLREQALNEVIGGFKRFLKPSPQL
jgi:O-antigen/teichoic acid export membrane protein